MGKKGWTTLLNCLKTPPGEKLNFSDISQMRSPSAETYSSFNGFFTPTHSQSQSLDKDMDRPTLAKSVVKKATHRRKRKQKKKQNRDYLPVPEANYQDQLERSFRSTLRSKKPLSDTASSITRYSVYMKLSHKQSNTLSVDFAKTMQFLNSRQRTRSADDMQSFDRMNMGHEARKIQERWIKTLGYECAQNYGTKVKGQPNSYISDIEVVSGLDKCFGRGQQRKIRPGELAICERHLRHLCKLAEEDQEILNTNSYTIVLRVIKLSRLEYLHQYSTVIKQLECIWKKMTADMTSTGTVNHCTTKQNDPVMQELHDGEVLLRKALSPMSGRYKQKMNFIT